MCMCLCVCVCEPHGKVLVLVREEGSEERRREMDVWACGESCLIWCGLVWPGVAWCGLVWSVVLLLVQQAFRERPDTFSLGVCNGCQLMALLGFVPGE